MGLVPTKGRDMPNSKQGSTTNKAGSAGKGRTSVGLDKVISVATQAFLRYGYLGTSMKLLAKEIGTTAPALYWYFPSKEDLYIAVLETAMKDFSKSVSEAATSSDPKERLQQYVRAHVIWQLNQSDAARAFDFSKVDSDDIPSERFEEVHKLQIEYRNNIREVLERGQASGVFDIPNIKIAASAIITLCEYVHTWFNPSGLLSSKEVADAIVVLVLKMIDAK